MRHDQIPELRMVEQRQGAAFVEVTVFDHLTDPAHGDYSLRPGTPGIAAGVPLPLSIANAVGVPVTQHPTIGVLLAPRRP